MKKTILTMVLLLSATGQAQHKIKYVSPQSVERLLNDIYTQVPMDQLHQFLSPTDLRALEDYSKLDKGQIIENTFVVAAATGAAVAVVDYLWHRYVGKEAAIPLNIQDEYFNLESNEHSLPTYSSFTNAVPQLVTGPHAPKGSLWGAPRALPTSNGFNSSDNRVLVTPVLVAMAQATAGAVAYNAAKWGLKTAFGESAEVKPDLSEQQFDLMTN